MDLIISEHCSTDLYPKPVIGINSNFVKFLTFYAIENLLFVLFLIFLTFKLSFCKL